jgi:flagellar basal-body rod protein FlgB
MKTGLFDGITDLERVLDFHLARHSVLASNLANAETPGFKARDLQFSDALAAAQRVEAPESPSVPGASEAQAPRQDPGFVEVEREPSGVDGNGVRLEQAMAEVSANRLRYDTALEIAKRRMALLRYATGEG